MAYITAFGTIMNDEEDLRILNSWLYQWENNKEYREYTSENTEIFAKGNMLFIIPKEEKLTKPIKVIIA